MKPNLNHVFDPPALLGSQHSASCEHQSITEGVKYALTDRSELLAAWNQRIDNTDNQDFNTFTVGLNAKFGY
ncbi:MAG: hypothetical protein KFB96_25755 [Thiocapsa sp.]|uniref:hypothetical protein n=1 Tax=Thiocapsa sp. TaxID=2024551 RepID=UPI001BCA9252|nr:hypothetical protein [Thiocapsa sp.]QVL48896.1 MAG: hypothetical protein KFB96_25755 [Thiocapsa sp.]